ncbi:MAG: hypothetical protein JXA82_18695 [Sedimentisphaerales bacterium]|nr:hypothetical protein [Sedimentisphaerales bacterium]
MGYLNSYICVAFIIFGGLLATWAFSPKKNWSCIKRVLLILLAIAMYTGGTIWLIDIGIKKSEVRTNAFERRAILESLAVEWVLNDEYLRNWPLNMDDEDRPTGTETGEIPTIFPQLHLTAYMKVLQSPLIKSEDLSLLCRNLYLRGEEINSVSCTLNGILALPGIPPSFRINSYKYHNKNEYRKDYEGFQEGLKRQLDKEDRSLLENARKYVATLDKPHKITFDDYEIYLTPNRWQNQELQEGKTEEPQGN